MPQVTEETEEKPESSPGSPGLESMLLTPLPVLETAATGGYWGGREGTKVAVTLRLPDALSPSASGREVLLLCSGLAVRSDS